uniref:NADH dehydrogenase subunit 6 n=1 Tax=Amblyseiulella paraheveae TaxID=3049516 RepID=A0AAU6PBF9_9ACAR
MLLLSLLKLTMMMMMTIFCLLKSLFIKIWLFMIIMVLAIFLEYFFLKSSWFPLMFMILIMSGLMVIFIYITSMLKKNSWNYVNSNKNKIFIILFLFSFYKLIMKLNKLNMISTQETDFLNMLLNWNYLSMSLFLMIYMFIILFISMDLLTNLKNSFRSKM